MVSVDCGAILEGWQVIHFPTVNPSMMQSEQRLVIIGQSSSDKLPVNHLARVQEGRMPAMWDEAGTDRNHKSFMPLHTTASLGMQAF